MVSSKKKTGQGRNKLQPHAREIVRSTSLGISQCSADYAKVLINPFGSFEVLPCIPKMPALPSYKFHAFSRGTVVVGTAGCGFIMAKGDVTSTNINMIINSLSNYTQAYGTTDQSKIGVAAGSLVQLPYTSTTSGIEGRVVGCGLRVRYVGTELNRGGSIHLVCLPDNPGDFDGVSGPAVNLNLLQAFRAPVDRRWHMVTKIPYHENQLNYDILGAGSASTNYNLRIEILGATPGEAFEYEFVQYCEYQNGGTSTAVAATQIPEMTESHGDLSGLGQVLGAAQPSGMQSTGGLGDYVNHFIEKFFDPSNLSTAAIQAMDIITKYGIQSGMNLVRSSLFQKERGNLRRYLEL